MVARSVAGSSFSESSCLQVLSIFSEAQGNALTVVLSADFDIKQAPFWLLILMDTGLLIIRDADLW